MLILTYFFYSIWGRAFLSHSLVYSFYFINMNSGFHLFLALLLFDPDQVVLDLASGDLLGP